MFDRRKALVLTTAALLAGCKVIPTAPPPTPTPPPGPSEALPEDQKRHRIALLLPLTGPNAQVGQSVANATTMALLDTNAQTIRITTYDTASDPAAAAGKAMKDGNKLILGPLLGDEVSPVVKLARAGKVPLLTYANDAGLAAPDVFVMGVSPRNAVERIVGFAAKQGIKRFALLYPSGDYGARAKAAYAQSVIRAGGTLTQSESYDRSNTSIVSAAQRMRAKGGFDAVLIADSGKFAALAAPQLRPKGATSPRILGTELWSGETVVASTAALRGAWFPAISDTRFRQFGDSYKARFDAAPYRLATMGYDSVLLSVRIARDWKPGSAFPVARLTDADGFLGLDGPFRFTAGGEGERALEVREVRAGTIAIVSPAPDKFVP
jgi:ABC-type branched-subunit amino acid transport system substrate-binding protein